VKATALKDAMDAERRSNIRETFTILTERERKVIELRYGLGDRPAMTQRQIAAEWGVSKQAIEQTEKRAKEKLRWHPTIIHEAADL
jgi:RNA polymerase sigma factor (sigma-70 family)